MNWAYAILSFLGLAAFVAAAIIKGEEIKKNLFFVISGSMLVGISYLFTDGGINGAISSFLGGAQAIVNYFFSSRDQKIPRWLIIAYALMFVGLNLAVIESPIGLLALFASLCFVGSISAKNGKGYRFWQMINNLLWISYDFLTKSYGPLAIHSVLFGFILIGMLLNDYKIKRK